MSEHVASKLKLFRQVLGWTQEHLAEAAGLSSRTVQRAENGEEMSGETLQALAAVFDLSVAVLRQPVPSEDEIRKGAEEAQKRYKFIALTKIERASDLQGYMGADAWQVDHVAGLSEEQEDEIAVLEELLRDYGDLWSDLEPTHRREALKTIFETIARLTRTGLIVAAGCDAMRLVTAGSPEPFGMDVLRVVVSKAEQPQLFAVREKNARVKSPKGDQATRNPQGSNQVRLDPIETNNLICEVYTDGLCGARNHLEWSFFGRSRMAPTG